MKEGTEMATVERKADTRELRETYARTLVELA